MEAPLMIVNDLSVGYQDRLLIEHATFTLLKGKVYGLKGKNGAGKSTLLNTLAARKKPISGSVQTNTDEEGISYCIQRSYLHARMTPKETLETILYLNGKRFEESEFIRSLSDTEREKWGRIRDCQIIRLSGGEEKWISILSSLELDREILIFDEPMNGLDVESRSLLWKSIKRKRDRGTMILVTSHLEDELHKNADCVMSIENKRIVLL